jgi:hypothetical protein
MSRPSPDRTADEEAIDPIDIVRAILEEAGTLSQLMEMYYLFLEPGLLDIMRGIAAFPDEDRERLLRYLIRHSRQGLGIRELPDGALVFEPETPGGGYR